MRSQIRIFPFLRPILDLCLPNVCLNPLRWSFPMLILGDEGHYHGRFPWVTAALVVINVVVYVAQVVLGEPFTNGFSLVPEEIVTFRDLQGTKFHKVKIEVEGTIDRQGHYHPRYETKNFPIKHYPGPFPIFLTLFTSMFMHG